MTTTDPTSASMGGPLSEAERIAEIQARLDNLAYNTPPWTAEHDPLGTDINFGDHYQVIDADNDFVAVVENEPVAELLLHAPADLEHLLRLLKLTRRAYEDAKETREKYAQRVIGWREQCSLATGERDAALVRVGVLEGQLATAREELDGWLLAPHHDTGGEYGLYHDCIVDEAVIGISERSLRSVLDDVRDHECEEDSRAPDTAMDPFEAADDIYRRWE